MLVTYPLNYFLLSDSENHKMELKIGLAPRGLNRLNGLFVMDKLGVASKF